MNLKTRQIFLPSTGFQCTPEQCTKASVQLALTGADVLTALNVWLDDVLGNM